MPHVLVTGGAGYIGAHTVRRLLAAGLDVTVLDDLSAGHASSVPAGVRLLGVDLTAETETVRAVTLARPDAVVHFAGAIEAGLSMTDPARFYRVNVLGSFHVAEALRLLNCPPLVYSSSAAVYGDPDAVPIPETARMSPTNVYGRTKLDTEGMFAAYRGAYGLRSTALRYFNAAGAAADATLGEAHRIETHLIPLALRAVASGEPVTVFGTDYPTPDGSCIRDYVHVDDLADAHVLAVQALLDGGAGATYNVGLGVGFSVLEVLAAVGRVTGTAVPQRLSDRRPGDPAELVADSTSIRTDLGWSPAHTDLDDIVTTAHAWHSAQ